MGNLQDSVFTKCTVDGSMIIRNWFDRLPDLRQLDFGPNYVRTTRFLWLILDDRLVVVVANDHE